MNDLSLETRHSDILYGPQQAELLREEILADLLEASARRTPQHIALISGTRRITYAELDQMAGLAASRLIANGVQPGAMVGLWMPRGIDLLVMQAAIAKAGAAWLPIDEDTPVERLEVCMEDASAVGVVTSASFAPRLAGLSTQSWTAEALLASSQPDEVIQVRGDVSPDLPAYVIYT